MRAHRGRAAGRLELRRVGNGSVDTRFSERSRLCESKRPAGVPVLLDERRRLRDGALFGSLESGLGAGILEGAGSRGTQSQLLTFQTQR